MPGVRLRLVHGFTQTPQSWDAMTRRLDPMWDVQALEVPDGLDFAATASALGARGGTGIYVGYSMGGRLCLQLALDHPAIVERLVLVSASPGIEDPGARRDRRSADERLAADLERDGVRLFLERWIAQPMFNSLPPGTADLAERLRGSSVQRLAHQLRALGPGTQTPLWDRLDRLHTPTVLVTGAFDRTYCEIAARAAAAIGPHAVTVTVPDTGHAVHLERPDAMARILIEHSQVHEALTEPRTEPGAGAPDDGPAPDRPETG